MSALLALAGQWRWIAAALLAGGLVLGGWWVKGKVARAAEADRLEVELDVANERLKEQIEATHRAERSRIEVSNKLAQAKKASMVKTKEIERYVRQAVTRDPQCNIPPDVLRALNATRGDKIPVPAE